MDKCVLVMEVVIAAVSAPVVAKFAVHSFFITGVVPFAGVPIVVFCKV
jgi:hypothetical protein